MARLATMPLDRLPIMALDLETTGLNTRHDRVIQIGMVALNKPQTALSVLVKPDISIPAQSTAIHGISDGDVADADPFAIAFASCKDKLADHVIMGYNIGFDLAILSAETERYGIEWHFQAGLCLRQLATIALGREAMLMMGDLDQLAAHYGVDNKARHSALGDAQIAAAIYIKLIDDLRSQSIITFGDARRAVAQLDDQRMATTRAGWVDVASQKAKPISSMPLARIDPYPYRHKIHDIMMTNPLILKPDDKLLDAAAQMRAQKVDCVFIGQDKEHIEGIVSERDLVRAMATPFEEMSRARNVALKNIMSAPVISVSETDYMHVALGRIARHDIRHLGVIDSSGTLSGWLSTRELIRQRVSDALVIGDTLHNAKTASEMAGALRQLPTLASSLSAEGVAAYDIAGVISGEYRNALSRAAQLAEAKMRAQNNPPPRSFAVLVLGSAGRNESLLAADQDHAIIYDDKTTPIPEDKKEAFQNWFEDFGRQISDILDEAGIPYCKGGVMSSSPVWCKTLTQWRTTIRDWCRNPSAEALLSVDIFFDFALVYGDAQLGAKLQQAISGRAARQPDFLKLLARNVGSHHAGTGLFGRLKLDEGRFQTKLHMMLPLTEILRVLAISRSIEARNSYERATLIFKSQTVPPEIVQLGEDIQFCIKLILRQQIEDIASGLAPTTNIDLALLTDKDHKQLKSINGRIGRLDQLLQDCLFH